MSIAPDCLFPSSNELGIPDRLLSMQADYVDLPVKPWGSIARTRTHRGTYHFYVDDSRSGRRTASNDILFAVYGHSKWARRMCENHGWIFLNQDHWPPKTAPLQVVVKRPESLEAWI